jgi:hypothetical protein
MALDLRHAFRGMRRNAGAVNAIFLEDVVIFAAPDR